MSKTTDEDSTTKRVALYGFNSHPRLHNRLKKRYIQNFTLFTHFENLLNRRTKNGRKR